VKEGRFTGTEHSIIRSNERRIEALDIVEVIENGYHEKNKDEYREDFQSWNYAIRGKTIDGDELRVAVFFKDDAVVVATVIRL
jgi:putative lipase involved disintegration of autophagic bodies